MDITRTIVLPCPPDEVWACLTDPERLRQWIPGLIEDVPTSDGPLAVGTTSRIRMREGGRVVEYDSEVTRCEVNRRLAIRMTGGSLKNSAAAADYRVEDLGGGRSRLEYASNVRLGDFALPMRPLLWIGCRVNAARAMRGLTRLVATRGD